MANISIVFPRIGSPVVMGDPVGVLSGEPITWQIYTQKKSIKSVKLAFKTQGKIFEGADLGPNECLKNFTFNDKTGFAIMVGQAPDLRRRRVDKYTIYGYSGRGGRGTEVAKLDPTIITDPPAPPIGQG